ncbi:MAG: flagellar basal body rod modification protein, partial [Bacteroidota bacterium]
VVYIGGTNLYRSNDGFATPSGVWIGGYRDVSIDSTVRLELEYPHHHPDQHTLVFSPSNPSVIYTGSDGGIHRSDDGGAANVSWTPLNNGYFTSQFYSVAIDHATPGDNTVVGGLQDNGTWMSALAAEGTHWDSVGSGDGSFCAIADGRTSMYVAKQQGKAYRVLLNGNGKLSQYARIDPLGGKKYLFISPYILDPANTNAMYLTAGSELWYNNDVTAIPLSSQQAATINWNRMQGATVSDTVSISALGVSRESPAHRLYYGTSNGMIYRIDNATTPDAAVVDITPTVFSRKGYINCVAVDPADGNRAVVVFSNYGLQSLYVTTDAGATWTPIGGNLEGGTAIPGSGPSCRWFAFLHRPNGTIYLVGTSTGLYSTTGLYGSKTVWLQEGASTIGNMVVDMIDVRQSDGYIVAGTHGGGVYSTTIAQLGVENDRLADAAGFELRGNIPNPVSDITKIDYSIGGSGTFPVQLKIFNARGEEVATLVDRPETAGEYSVSFDSRSAEIALPSGVYYYRLQVGAEARTREMQIVR